MAVGLVLLLIVYGSLFPFRWNFAAPQAFVWGGPVGLTDLVENVLLFLPLGALLGWDGAARARPWRHALVWLVLAVATLWVVATGTREEDAARPRTVSVFARGLVRLRWQLLRVRRLWIRLWLWPEPWPDLATTIQLTIVPSLPS